MKLCPICLSEYSDEHTTCPSDSARLIETKEWQPGQMVANNKYLIVAKIGRGGMGTVFKASHVALDEIRALKLMDPQFARDPQFVARFRNEAKAARRLSHPNAVHVDDPEYDSYHDIADIPPHRLRLRNTPRSTTTAGARAASLTSRRKFSPASRFISPP